MGKQGYYYRSIEGYVMRGLGCQDYVSRDEKGHCNNCKEYITTTKDDLEGQGRVVEEGH